MSPSDIPYRRKTYYVGTPDEQAIAALRERHGFSTDSDAVRYALRELDLIEQNKRKRSTSNATN